MLSFLLDDNTWPSSPRPFKQTNLMLHLLNGLLLFLLSKKLLSLGEKTSIHTDTIALIITSFWLLHPLNVSTVLYPIQRMTMLSTAFTLIGLFGYIYGRERYASSPGMGTSLIITSLVLATLLAVFSKENGALLPSLALVIEITALRQLTPLPLRWKITLLWVPSIIIVTYLLTPLFNAPSDISQTLRPFSTLERLITQPRVLLDYLYYWFVPQYSSQGLLTQDFPVSRGLFSPPNTFISIFLILALFLGAVIIRNKYPSFSLAFLFFFTGHLIESTTIPLELYFEHRNYLPAIFLILPIIHFAFRKINSRVVLTASILSVILVAGVQMGIRAKIWADENTLSLQWAKQHPYSQRAQRFAANSLQSGGDPISALRIIEKAHVNLPDSIAIQLHRLLLRCQMKISTSQDNEETLDVLINGKYSFKSYEFLHDAISRLYKSGCTTVSHDTIQSFVDGLLINPKAQLRGETLQHLHHIKGELYLNEGNIKRAAHEFRASIRALPNIESILMQVALLASNGYFKHAGTHLMLTNDKALTGNFPRYKKEIQRLDKMIQDEISADESELLPGN